MAHLPGHRNKTNTHLIDTLAAYYVDACHNFDKNDVSGRGWLHFEYQQGPLKLIIRYQSSALS
ncbi:hypothetical protein BJX63DRAFT_389022 [Aspergillus granulosus]|uniref:Uncharacterized protein n=1 Tax=Aspergillus granulosus TaxID=176169 RepID=A0ABR4HKH2_9EURO